MKTEYFDVTGITCFACSSIVEKSFSAVKGEALEKWRLRKRLKKQVIPQQELNKT